MNIIYYLGRNLHEQRKAFLNAFKSEYSFIIWGGEARHLPESQTSGGDFGNGGGYVELGKKEYS